MDSDTEGIDYDEPLQARTSLFEEYGPRLTSRMKSKLFPIQYEALSNLMEWFSDDKTRDQTAVVQMPTGSGKTGIIACLPYTFGNMVKKGKISLDLKKPMLIIAPGKVILEQLEENLKRSSHTECFLMKRDIIKSTDAEDAYYSVELVQSSYQLSKLAHTKSNIILSNAQKFNPHPQPTTWRDLPDDMFSVVIVDEAHHLPAKQWEQIISKFRQPTTKVIFFTATPNRADGKKITTDGALNRCGFAYVLTREIAIREGYIRDVEFISSHEGTEQNITYDRSATDKRMKFAKPVVQNVVELLKSKDIDNPLPEGKTHAALIIARDTKEANEVKEMAQEAYPDMKDAIAEVHTNVHEDMRKTILDDLFNGKIKIIVVVSMLLEGFDYPPISVVGIVTRIYSCVKFAQFVGRAQRIVRSKKIGATVERGVKAHIVTHDYFQQKDLFDDYIAPQIPMSDDDRLFKSLDSEND